MRLIDADALIYDLEIEPLTDDGGVDANDLDDIIKRQPTIDAVEVVHGEWIEVDDFEGAIKGRVVCSNCKNPFESIVMTNEKIILTNQKTNYCPNCGAKMDGERRTE